MKALVLFSGGIDSTTALGLAIKKYVRYFNIVTAHCFNSLQKTFRRRVTQNRFQKQMVINQ
ncbi:Uncharacterised protein [Dorea longicatena]|nr:Uncharacterised protein [Dorea longicatena]